MAQVSLSKQNAQRIVKFLKALTADSSRDLTGAVPTSVPSGLPVAD